MSTVPCLFSPQPPNRRPGSRKIAATAALAACALALSACATDGSAPGATASSTPAASSRTQLSDPTDTSASTSTARPGVRDRLAHLETERGARLGVHAVDTSTGATVSYRGDERFAYASTIKALAAGAVLDDLGPAELSRRLFFTEDELVDYSPVTELHVEDGLSVRQLIDAAITVSDNTAGNLLIDLLGGPAGLDEALLEDAGDDVTAVVRREPDLNTAVPGDSRDTTTPVALADTLGAYVLGDVLPRADRRFLEQVLRRTTTGDALIRAGVPQGWRVGDKTGSAAYGTRNDVAVIRPPGRGPILLAIMTTHDEADAPTDDALIAAATRIVVDELLDATPGAVRRERARHEDGAHPYQRISQVRPAVGCAPTLHAAGWAA
ncbi:class A beta-lactamase [Nocardioides mesophilus]|uniref:Beta-lactamase n=1 Tax=Nocardioides mesophilus TaxID=433659 RepID=A0A7G9RC95_9ACTN|nr:class A beta-lactamase [Nocardioides mesophilus]QNN53220.1 class A beta-lactamase [Nocardioides mesophilus]